MQTCLSEQQAEVVRVFIVDYHPQTAIVCE